MSSMLEEKESFAPVLVQSPETNTEHLEAEEGCQQLFCQEALKLGDWHLKFIWTPSVESCHHLVLCAEACALPVVGKRFLHQSYACCSQQVFDPDLFAASLLVRNETCCKVAALNEPGGVKRHVMRPTVIQQNRTERNESTLSFMLSEPRILLMLHRSSP